MNNTLKHIKTFFNTYFRNRKNILAQGLVFSAFFAFMEIFFHITEKMEITSTFVFPILFSIPLGFFFTALFSLFPRNVNCILSTVTAALTGVWFGTQICYASVFQTYMEFSKVTMAGDVAEGFGGEMKDAIFDSIPKIIAIALIVAVFSLIIFILIRPGRKSPFLCAATFIVALILQALCVLSLSFGGNGAYAPKNMYKQFPRVLDNNMRNFGVMTSFRLDISDTLFGHKSSEQPSFQSIDPNILMPVTVPIETQPQQSGTDGPDETQPQQSGTDGPDETQPQQSGTTKPDETQPRQTETRPSGETQSQQTSGTTKPVEPPKPSKNKNVIDVDYSKIIASEKDKNLLAIHNYVNSQNGSYVNKYTGMFEGYNLIMICAESFTSHMISPELTPTLYKMSNGGFVFNNFYGMMKSITTNGEYAFCTGLIPNSQGNVDDLKKNSTFLLSADKYLPYCMGNMFDNVGATTCAYHSNKSTTYHRDITHPNMGFKLCRFLDGGYVDGVFDESLKLTFTTKRSVPNSDYECAQQSLSDYLDVKNADGTVKQFCAYYMSYSGHHPYYDIADTTHTLSPMTKRNREIVDPLPYSERTKSYLAANLELEKMVTEMLARLEEAGCLENTVIVLTNDHYPYGLLDNEYRELAGKKVDATFGIFENSFICYCAGMDPVQVDTPCCTVDIIPTLLNLFGFEYDSRLLAGTDILDPNSFHIAMLYNQCFITDKIKYNTSKGKVTYLVDKSEVPNGYVDACIAYVKNKFEISLQIVKNDYYKVFYDIVASQK